MLRDILVYCSADSSPPSFCALLHPAKKHRRHEKIMQGSEPASGQGTTGQSPGNSKTKKYTPGGAASTSSASIGSSSLTASSATPSIPGGLNVHSGQVPDPAGVGPNESLWVTFGVDGSQSTPEVDQIGSVDLMFDHTFIKELRSRHKKLRGWMRSYLSIWRLHYWEFVKVSKLSSRSVRYLAINTDQSSSAGYD